MSTHVTYVVRNLVIRKNNVEKALAAVNKLHQSGKDYYYVEMEGETSHPNLSEAMWKWLLCEQPGKKCKLNKKGDFIFSGGNEGPFVPDLPKMLRAIAPYTEDCTIKVFGPGFARLWTIADGKFSQVKI
jgi:hypothetical protein